MHPKLADALRSVFDQTLDYSSSDVGGPTDAPARARAFGRLLDQHVLRGSLERLGIRHLRHVEEVTVTVTIIRDEPRVRSWTGDVHRTAGQIRGYDATFDLSKTPLADWTPYGVLHVATSRPSLEVTRSVARSIKPQVCAYLLTDVSTSDLTAAWRKLETLDVDELALETSDDELTLHDLHGADEHAAARHFAAKRAAIEREILRRG